MNLIELTLFGHEDQRALFPIADIAIIQQGDNCCIIYRGQRVIVKESYAKIHKSLMDSRDISIKYANL